MSLDNTAKPTWHVMSIYSTVVANIQQYKNQESINNNLIHCKIIFPYFLRFVLDCTCGKMENDKKKTKRFFEAMNMNMNSLFMRAIFAVMFFDHIRNVPGYNIWMCNVRCEYGPINKATAFCVAFSFFVVFDALVDVPKWKKKKNKNEQTNSNGMLLAFSKNIFGMRNVLFDFEPFTNQKDRQLNRNK